MLLQRNQDILIWGKAHSGKEILIKLKDHEYKTKSDKNNNWTIHLGKHPAGGPYEIKIKSDKEEIILQNVLLGDQWLVVGEAIVNFPLAETNDFVKEIVAAEKLPNIRYFNADLLPEKLKFEELNKDALWQALTPENVSKLPAVPYYLAKALNQATNVPIGIIKVAEDYIPMQALLSTADEASTEPETSNGATELAMEHHYKARFDTNLNLANGQMLKLSIDKITEGDLTLFINEERIGEMKETDQVRSFNIPVSLVKSKYNNIELRVTNVDDMSQLSRDQMNLRIDLASGTKSESIFRPGYKWHYGKQPDISVPGLIFKEMLEPLLNMKFSGVLIYQGDSNLNDVTNYRVLLVNLINNIQSYFGNTRILFLGLRRVGAYNPDQAHESEIRSIQRQVMATHKKTKFIETSDLEFKTSAQQIAARCLE
jgi:hypothetical protein